MKIKLIVFFGLVIMVVIGFIVTTLPQSLVPITSIECQVGSAPCSPDLIAQLRPLAGQSLFFSNIEQSIHGLNIELYELIDVHKRLPGSLLVDFKLKQNFYRLLLPGSTEPWTVAETGYAQQLAHSDSLPTIAVSSDWAQPLSDNRVDPSLHQLTSHLIRELTTNQVEFSHIELRAKQELVVFLVNGQQAWLSEEALSSQIKKLAIIQKNVDTKTIDTGIRIIDLRFELPVLKTS